MQKVLEPIQRVRFTKSTLRHAKLEGRSHEKTERQQRCARSKAWNLAKTFTTSKKKTRLHSSFPGGMVTPAASTKEPDEREL